MMSSHAYGSCDYCVRMYFFCLQFLNNNSLFFLNCRLYGEQFILYQLGVVKGKYCSRSSHIGDVFATGEKLDKFTRHVQMLKNKAGESVGRQTTHLLDDYSAVNLTP